MDAHKNFALSTMASPPSSTDGTELTVATGHGTRFPAAPFNVTLWPAGVAPTVSNAEIVRVTNKATDVFTVTRAQEGSSARTHAANDQIAATVTAKTLEDVEDRSAGFLNVAEYGAVGDGITDDTDAIQDAIDACMADPLRPLALRLAGRHLVSSSLLIDAGAETVTTPRMRDFVISGGIIYTTTAITLFSATADHSAQSVGRQVTFREVGFECSSAATAAYVLDGAFIQVRFDHCTFNKIKCQTTSGVNTFSYSFEFCQLTGWTGTFFTMAYVSINDIAFHGCEIDQGAAVVDFGLVQGFKFTNNTIENLTGVPITLKGSRALSIQGNYFEFCSTSSGSYYVDLNSDASGELNGVDIGGNLFYLNQAQYESASFWAINWASIGSGFSHGNWSLGLLHRVTGQIGAGGFVSRGDAHNPTGALNDRIPYLQLPWGGLSEPTEAVLVSGVDVRAVSSVKVTLTAARVVGAPLNPTSGQRVVFTFVQDGTGGWGVTWNAVFKVTWADTGNTLNTRSSIAFVYDGTNWNQDGAQTPYV